MDSVFPHQQSLPQLPVPTLSDTCGKLVSWASPLLTEQECNATQSAVEQFIRSGGAGEKLQEELNKWSQDSSRQNWSSQIWEDVYLESRGSLAINNNVFYYLKSQWDNLSWSQAQIATGLIISTYGFISLIDEDKLTTDMQKEKPLCMNQYSNVFSSTRIPRKNADEFKVSSVRTHIIIMCSQRMFKLNILDEKGTVRSPVAIESDLNRIISGKNLGSNLGILTTMPRDDWAEKRENLFAISEHNSEVMKSIEEAAFVVCLDKNKPEEMTEISQQLLHGDGTDRFFDKSLQFVVFQNGKAGINFEHTGVDGSVMLRVIKHLHDSIGHVVFDAQRGVDEPFISSEELVFELNDGLNKAIDDAVILYRQHAANTQTRVLSFTAFGKTKIKAYRVSPDAFVQLALQLAEYKLYGKCYSAYEAVMTRTFFDGRIDVLYTVSPESLAFIQSLNDPSCTTQDKQGLLVQATKKHVSRANECRSGQGVFTHFQALRYCYKKVGSTLGLDTLPEIFTDKGYRALTESVVCTSTTSEYGVELAGYGPIVDHGYGIRYFTRNDDIRFNMTSRTAISDNLDKMHRYVEESLLEMAELMSG